MAKIMYGADWQQVGEATSTSTSSKNDGSAEEKKPKTIMTMYAFNGATPFYFAMPEIEKMKGDAVNQVTNQIFG